MTRRYEVVYIFESALEEAQVKEHLARLHALLATPEKPEPITASTHWGKRTLAYAIRGREVGYYVLDQFETDPALLPEFERALKLDESIVRHLLVLNEGEAPRPVRVATRPDEDDEEGEEAEESE